MRSMAHFRYNGSRPFANALPKSPALAGIFSVRFRRSTGVDRARTACDSFWVTVAAFREADNRKSQREIITGD
jgi:hypothetical protein